MNTIEQMKKMFSIIENLSSVLREVYDREQRERDLGLFDNLELQELIKENEQLKKELKEYEILVNCSDLDNFNPAHFQKNDIDEED